MNINNMPIVAYMLIFWNFLVNVILFDDEKV